MLARSSSRASKPQKQLLKRRFTARTLPQLRVSVEDCAAWAGMAEPRRGEFVLAVDAVTTNVIEHAGGEGLLLLRRIDNELEAQVADSGPGFTEDVIPELLPGLDGGPGGRGLWLARLTTDRLTIEAAQPDIETAQPGIEVAQPGAVVTLGVRLDLPPGDCALRRPGSLPE